MPLPIRMNRHNIQPQNLNLGNSKASILLDKIKRNGVSEPFHYNENGCIIDVVKCKNDAHIKAYGTDYKGSRVYDNYEASDSVALNETTTFINKDVTKKIIEDIPSKTTIINNSDGTGMIMIENKLEKSSYRIDFNKTLNLRNKISRFLFGSQKQELSSKNIVTYTRKGQVIAKAVDGKFVYLKKNSGLSENLLKQMKKDSSSETTINRVDITNYKQILF